MRNSNVERDATVQEQAIELRQLRKRPTQGPIRISRTDAIDEVTARTERGRFHLRPSARANDLILGCIARAQEHYPVRLHAFVFMSNHYHMLVSTDDARQLSNFTGFVNGNVAREINRLNDHSGAIWRKRFRAIPINNDDVTQRARLRYLLAHGVKEGLVDSVQEWPGASSLPWLLEGHDVTGVWVDRTAMGLAKRRGARVSESQFERRITLRFDPMPCFAGLAAEKWRGEIAAIVDDILAEFAPAAPRPKTLVVPSRRSVGRDAVLAMDPMTRPPKMQYTRAPTVHAHSGTVRREWAVWLGGIRRDYHVASVAFRRGDFSAPFPPGVFRPHASFVPLPPQETGVFVGPCPAPQNRSEAARRGTLSFATRPSDPSGATLALPFSDVTATDESKAPEVSEAMV